MLDEGDLTTDAAPVPPRDGGAERKPRPDTKAPKFGKRKTSQSAFSTVINISGSNGVHFGPNINMYVGKQPEAKAGRQFPVTEDVEALFASTARITREDIVAIAPHVTEQWQDVARCLGYSEGQIVQLRLDHIESGIKEVIIQFLLDWMRNDDEALVGRLAKALWTNNQEDCVQRWAQFSK